MNYHKPVMLKEAIDALEIVSDGIYVDVTFGGGGHSREIIKRLGKTGRLVAFDQDEDAKKNTIDDDRFCFVDKNFKYLKNYIKFFGIKEVDGILADLGVSSYQFDVADRGFSIRFKGDLDMRMDRRQEFAAEDLINNYEERDLSRIFYMYGELKNARKIANIICAKRKESHIKTTDKLIEILNPIIPKYQSQKFLAKVFQALRIEVNKEMESLKEMLLSTSDLIKPGGRLVVLTYHSLEDRIVKRFMQSGNFEGKLKKDFYGNDIKPFKQINRKPIIVSEEDLEENKRARSAKLRIAEKI